VELDLPSGAGGAGVGLNIARRVAESHGGTVEVGSPEEGGPALVLRLPVVTPVTVVEA
jgi:signal transduction histidine kinase